MNSRPSRALQTLQGHAGLINAMAVTPRGQFEADRLRQK